MQCTELRSVSRGMCDAARGKNNELDSKAKLIENRQERESFKGLLEGQEANGFNSNGKSS